MKQQTAYKILAAFMVLTMVFSVFAYIFIGAKDENNTQANTQLINETNEQKLWTFNEPLYSISDGLKITPPGAVNAEFIDLNSMTPQMMQWAKQVKVDLVDYPIIDWTGALYNSTTDKLYYAHLKEGQNGSFVLLNNINSQKINFQYEKDESGSPPVYLNQYLLIRQEDEYKNFINVMGTPSVFAPWPTLEKVINISVLKNNTTKTAYDEYEGLLSYAENAPYQRIVLKPGFADQFYEGVRKNNDSYERKTIYLNLNSTSIKNLTMLSTNSTQKGFTLYDIKQYNVTQTTGSEFNTSHKLNQSYTVVKVAGPDLLRVLSEETH
jgi:hypothetical protein